MVIGARGECYDQLTKLYLETFSSWVSFGNLMCGSSVHNFEVEAGDDCSCWLDSVHLDRQLCVYMMGQWRR